MHFMAGNPDIADRLIEAREAAGYKTAKDATEAFGFNYPTYAGHENGSRGIGRSAARYAAAYKVSLEWLLTGRGAMKRKDSHPVLDLFQSLPPEKQAQAIDYMAFLRDRRE